MTFYESIELFRKYPKTSDFDHSNYRLFERIPAVPGTWNNRGLTVFQNAYMVYKHAVVAAFRIYAQLGEVAAKRGGWSLCIK